MADCVEAVFNDEALRDSLSSWRIPSTIQTRSSGSPPQPTRFVSGVISIPHSFFAVIYTIDDERGWSRG